MRIDGELSSTHVRISAASAKLTPLGSGSEKLNSCAADSTSVVPARPPQLADDAGHVGRRHGTDGDFGGDNRDVHWCLPAGWWPARPATLS